MVIVAGHITVDPEQRESYLAGSMSVVEKARRADGCLDFASLPPKRPPQQARRGNALGKS
jgi:quinol monooxygenase YgiN